MMATSFTPGAGGFTFQREVGRRSRRRTAEMKRPNDVHDRVPRDGGTEISSNRTPRLDLL